MPSTRPRLRTLASTALLVTALGTGLTACGSDSEASSDASSSASADATMASEITMEDPWVKAVDSGMTAAFGTLENSGGSDATLVSVTSDASDTIQLHETVEKDGTMQMQEKDGGFTIAAGGDHELSPGGDHIMFMDVTDALEPGDTVTLTLTFSDDSTLDVDATVKDYSGADESYSDGSDDSSDDMSGMDMSSEGSDS
ncbi:copper chaperone PCu(A)C [Nocardioides sp. GY 10127]|nr:copper chaperone PCu(A)C [Nocardioides sp. GY 10127]